MALSKDEIALLKEMIADPSVPKDEKDMYRETLEEVVVVKTTTTAKKPTAKKKAKPKKKKVSPKDLDTLKAQIKKRTGKTEEECEKIVAEYKALRKKSTTRKKKEKAQSDQSKKRVSKLKKEGKIIKGTDEKNVEATIETATKQATKKVDKEITKIEKSTKSEKQVEKKIDKLVKKALASSKKFVSDMAKELASKSKDDGRTYLLGLRSQIDSLLKKYELGGEVFDGSGDIVDYGGGGMTQTMDIQQGLVAVGNNTASPTWSYASGGKTQGYNDRGDEELGMKDGRSSKYHQNYKDRRDEMKGENRGVGNRPYGSFARGGKNWVGKVVDSPNFRKGAFTKKAEAVGLTPEQFQNEVLANPNEYDLRTRRQAQFMKNAFNE